MRSLFKKLCRATSVRVPSSLLLLALAVALVWAGPSQAQVLAPGDGACPAVVQGDELGCTANDIEIAFVEIVENGSTICVWGQPVTVTLDMHMAHNLNSGVSDVGIFVATDGGNIKFPDGAQQCRYKTLQPGLTNSNDTAENNGTPIPAGSVLMSDELDGPPDLCTDTYSGLGSGGLQAPLEMIDAVGNITIQCKAETTIDAVVGWNAQNKTCATPTDLALFQGSKCKISNDIPVEFAVLGNVRVCKTAVPPTDGVFGFEILGNAYEPGSNVGGEPELVGGFRLDGSGQACINVEVFLGDEVTVSETSVATGEYGLAAIDCNITDGVEGDVTGQATATVALPGVTLTLSDDQPFVECEFTNSRDPFVTLIKDITNDNGGLLGTESFQGYINASPVAWEDAVQVQAGAVVVSEKVAPGYEQTGIVCREGNPVEGPIVGRGGEFEAELGTQYFCTIFNDDIPPKLTVTKILVNDDGGEKKVSDFTLYIDSKPVESGVQQSLFAGDFVVSEEPDENYTAIIGGDCDAEGNVSLAVGDEKECTITNDDNPPTLTLLKRVINDDIGELEEGDFVINLTGGQYQEDEFRHKDEPEIRGKVTYTVSETPPEGYELVSIVCEGASEGDGATFTAVSGDAVTCTVTNDDIGIAYFNVTKDFVPNSDMEVEVFISCNSGLPLDQSKVITEGSDGVTFVVEYTDGIADCTITEDPVPTGYEASYAASIVDGKGGDPTNEGNCFFPDVVGGDFSCKITNTAKDATYTVVKDWVIGDGGDLIDAVATVTIECDAMIDDCQANGTSEKSVGNALQDDHPICSRGVWYDYSSSTWKKKGDLRDNEKLVATVDITQGVATCSASEEIEQSGVEQASNGCGDTRLGPGATHTCTFTNTVFFEGIPTLSQYGLLLLALLTMGVGLVAVRRFV